MSEITVVAKLTGGSSRVRLAVSTSATLDSPVYSGYTFTTNDAAKLSVSGLAPATSYYYAIEVDDVLQTDRVGRFTTPGSGAQSFLCAFAGDAVTGSDHAVFARILAASPLLFLHLGDMHYQNIATNNKTLYREAFDAVLASPGQEALYRQVPTLYMWDDHDFGPDDSYGDSPGKAAACAVYRERVPHPTLIESSGPVYFTHRVGRVLFIVTDQRSMASSKTAADDASKSILGTAQKAWFKSVLTDAANAGLLFVWVCTRCWGGVATAGADHWGGFTAERTELADYFKAHCLGRICILSADMHSLAIDSGVNHDFATGGGAAIPVFQAAPLDKTGAETYGGATYDQGVGRYTSNGQFGTMAITDTGAGTMGVTWRGYDSTGAELVSYAFTASLA